MVILALIANPERETASPAIFSQEAIQAQPSDSIRFIKSRGKYQPPRGVDAAYEELFNRACCWGDCRLSKRERTLIDSLYHSSPDTTLVGDIDVSKIDFYGPRANAGGAPPFR